MISLRRVPGVQGVEDTLRLNRAARVANDHELPSRVAEVSLNAFGLLSGDTDFQFPDWVFERDWEDISDIEKQPVIEAYEHWFDQFQLDDDCDVITAWARVGWDITDEAGLPLMCLSYFERQMMCVAKGLRGRRIEEIGTEIWASGLKASSRPVANSQEKARNQAFLSLGGRPRSHRKARA